MFETRFRPNLPVKKFVEFAARSPATVIDVMYRELEDADLVASLRGRWVIARDDVTVVQARGKILPALKNLYRAMGDAAIREDFEHDAVSTGFLLALVDEQRKLLQAERMAVAVLNMRDLVKRLRAEQEGG